ncbi:uncharacterized protein C8Q71DRAFT_387454 [Rhodofomes roseus]|uniref:Uncharacterized protein n=1 Tax=Rhodofomes roseus TaxID=34475 RepID=A0ABQ8K0W0_9APHY|nr:uncharacterized protein C8Q71DRAFT_387454 [Rhodofomes roseus]KAH9830042.1 hypothetical protein C8Q71DRAFT_387454 [Rhodofomes roseus]
MDATSGSDVYCARLTAHISDIQVQGQHPSCFSSHRLPVGMSDLLQRLRPIHHDPKYDLPLAKTRLARWRKTTSWLRNPIRIALVGLAVVASFLLVKRFEQDSRKTGRLVEKVLDVLVPEPGPRAPLYERFREHELELSERTGDPPEAKYLFFANNVHGE